MLKVGGVVLDPVAEASDMKRAIFAWSSDIAYEALQAVGFRVHGFRFFFFYVDLCVFRGFLKSDSVSGCRVSPGSGFSGLGLWAPGGLGLRNPEPL